MAVDPRLSVAPPRSKRVLITGVGRFWGANLARQLEHDHALDFVCGIDTRDPLGEFGRTEVVKGDIRNPAISRLINVTRVDTVVHTQVFGADRPGESGRLLHDMNVIGTMNLLAACAASPFVRKVIIRSSTAMYGASPHDPAFFTEDMEAKSALRDQYSRDIAEVETYARDFADRAPHASVTILRFANSIGENVDTALTRYLSSQIVPTHAGYNPRLQFIQDTDAVDALAHAVRAWKPGTFNIAGSGTITLAKFLRMAGRIQVPLIPPMLGPAMQLLERIGVLYTQSRYDRTLKFKYVAKEPAAAGSDNVHKVEVDVEMVYKPPTENAEGLLFRIKSGKLEPFNPKKGVYLFDATKGYVKEAELTVSLKGTLKVALGNSTESDVELIQTQTTKLKTQDSSFVVVAGPVPGPGAPPPLPPMPPK